MTHCEPRSELREARAQEGSNGMSYQKPYELVVARRHLSADVHGSEAQGAFRIASPYPCAPPGFVERRFLALPGEEKIDEERGSMGVSGVFLARCHSDP